MASSLEYVQFAAEQMREAGNIVYKKMFGEYGPWCDGKFFGTIEEDQFYVKITEAGTRLLPGAKPLAPHGGSPGMYLVEDLDDRDFLGKLVRETCRELPAPKPRKPRSAAGKRAKKADS